MSGLLFRGRALLARRLSKYGLAVAGGALASASREAVAGVPAELAAETARVGVLVAAGQAVAVVAPAPVAALTEGVMKAMFLTKLKALTAGLMLACGVLTTGTAGWVAAEAGAQDRPSAGQPVKRGSESDEERIAKERIARLEHQREELLKLVADLRARVEVLEAGRENARTREAQEQLDAWVREAQNKAPNVYLNQPGGGDPKAAQPVAGATAALPAGQPATAMPMAGMRPGLSGPNAAPGVMSVKVYAVDGLAGDDKQAESLVKVLKAAVDPASWQGGAGVEYYPTGHALVVRQTVEGHQQVKEVLDLLRGAVNPQRKDLPGGGGPQPGGFPGNKR